MFINSKNSKIYDIFNRNSLAHQLAGTYLGKLQAIGFCSEKT